MSEMSITQQQAVIHKDGPMLVLAGPGSGKTRVITYRTQYLIEQHKVNPSEILVITFTKAAAMEMKERFLALMGAQASPVSFGTFHAVFFGILRHAYGYQVSNILREDQKLAFFKEIIQRMPLDIEDEQEFISDMMGEVSRVKNMGIPISEYRSLRTDERVFRKIYEQYDDRLRRGNLLDFDDMLVYCHELFRERKDILQAWQRKYRYILIDEFQDINRLQYDTIRMLAAPENNLFIVGDDDQSIYQFRGADPAIMLNFQKDYPEAKRILLDVNYRSSGAIVNGALRVIANNRSRFAKEIRPFQKEGHRILLHTFENQKQEYACVLDKIRMYAEKGGAYSDIAVLFRTNLQPGPLVEKLLEYNIPFTMKDTMPNLYEHWISKNIFTYIRMAMGSRKRSDFLQIMNRPKRYLSRESVDGELVSYEALLTYYDDKPWVCERIEKFQCDLRILAKIQPAGAIHYIRHVIGYEDYLKEYAAARHMKEEELFEVLDKLTVSAKDYKTFEEWFAHIESYTEELREQKNRQEEPADSVALATMHSSKGLEYRIVFIIDANEGITPYKKALLDYEIEEERRMFYVAMTRAKELLYIFSVKEQFHRPLEVSRFVEELYT